MKTHRRIARIVILTACLAGANARAETARTIFEVAQDIQSFYLLGTATIGDLTRDFYVMAGMSGKQKPVMLGATLINTSTGPGEHIQIVEVSSITCATRTLRSNARNLEGG